MVRKRKASPSVRIPASVLRREAQKAAKKMMVAEKRKEKLKATREKAKLKTKAKIEKRKASKEKNVEVFDHHVQREL